MYVIRIVAAAAAALAVAGCGSKLQCHDKVVSDTLANIILENAAKDASPDSLAAVFGDGRLSLSQTVEKSRTESGGLSCTGLLTADLGKASITPDDFAKQLKMGGAFIELERVIGQVYGGGDDRAERLSALRGQMPTDAGPTAVAWSIAYDVQRTSDGKDVFVNLQAAEPIITYAAAFAKASERAGKATPKPAAAAPADSGSTEGEYSNGSVTITDELGDHGGDELHSSLCPNEVFKPKFDGASGMLSAPDGSYAISFGAGHAHMDIEGGNKCFPEGRYRKVK